MNPTTGTARRGGATAAAAASAAPLGLSQEVKDLGRKARERLLEERNKRHEIVRLNDYVPPPGRSRAKFNSELQKFAAAAGRSNKRVLHSNLDSEQQQQVGKPQRRKRTRTRIAANHPSLEPGHVVDDWLPDCSEILDAAAVAEDDAAAISLSNVVRLHGLPVGATAFHIRQFFKGLDPPERIVVLLSNPNHFPAWDAADDRDHDNDDNDASANDSESSSDSDKDGFYFTSSPRKRDGNLETKNNQSCHMNRHVSTFRVLVEFSSDATAELAAKRSGEILWVTLPPPTQENAATAAPKEETMEKETATAVDKKEKRGATIAVTLLAARNVSKHCLENLGIDANTNPHLPLEKVLEAAEVQLHPTVSKILWTTIQRDLKLQFDKNATRRNNMEEISNDKDNAAQLKRDLALVSALQRSNISKDPFQLASSKSEQALLQERILLLKELHEKLSYQMPFPATECLDPSIERDDPVVHLSSMAAKQLQAEMERMEELLLQVHQRQFFFH